MMRDIAGIWLFIVMSYTVFIRLMCLMDAKEKIESYIYSHFNIRLNINSFVNPIIHIGVIMMLCVIPLLVYISWEAIGFMSMGLCFLYLGLGVYFRNDVFGEDLVYDEPVNYNFTSMLLGNRNMQCIGYYDLLVEPMITLGICSLIVSFYVCTSIMFSYYPKAFLVVLLEFINVTLLIFSDKINGLFKRDIRGPDGYYIYAPISIIWQLTPLVVLACLHI